MPKYSIIVPFYNVEDYILECAKSIHKQKYKDFEAIFIDDGSKDNTAKKLMEYFNKVKDDRLTLISKKNGGIAESRNYGCKKAKGKYIVFIDSDDFITENALTKINQKIEMEEPDILIFDFYEYYSLDYKIHRKGILDIGDGELLKRCIISPPANWNKVFKKSILTKNKIEYPKGLWYEDLATLPRILMSVDKISYLAEPLYYYRQKREGSIMNTINPKMFDMYPVLDILYHYYSDNHLLEKYKEELERIFIYNCFFVVNRLSISDSKNKIEEQKRMIAYLNSHFPNWYQNKYLSKEKGFTKRHIYIMKHPNLLWFYNLLRSVK